jgi:hypothetical protein
MPYMRTKGESTEMARDGLILETLDFRQVKPDHIPANALVSDQGAQKPKG